MTPPPIHTIDVYEKTVLVRVDLNVPMRAGKVTDTTRIARTLPTLRMLAKNGAKVVVISHFGRPKGHYDPDLSLAPLVDELSTMLEDIPVRFGVEAIGLSAHEAVAQTPFGEIILLENLRFYPQEVTGDRAFAQNLAALADIYVNEAFACSHRAHASIAGVPQFLPSYQGLLMAQELEILEKMFLQPERPLMAIVGGSKISTKLELLGNLLQKVDKLVIGGAMANTFLYAQGYELGRSLYEMEMKDTALDILAQAKQSDCEIILPQDMVVSNQLAAQSHCQLVPISEIPADHMALDIGPLSLHYLTDSIRQCRTVIWNGPMGAFETSPFDSATVQVARMIAYYTSQGQLQSIAGGGDTVSALAHAGLKDAFTYLSTAGGAFLEWMEGKPLPGVLALGEHRKAG